MPGPSVMVRVLGDVTGLGKSFDESASKGSASAGKMHDAFRGVLDQLNQTGVLGPFGAALAGADSAIESITGHAKEIGPVMMGVGAAVAGVGLALQAAGSKDAAAHAQLQASVEATGRSYDTYAGQVTRQSKSRRLSAPRRTIRRTRCACSRKRPATRPKRLTCSARRPTSQRPSTKALAPLRASSARRTTATPEYLRISALPRKTIPAPPKRKPK